MGDKEKRPRRFRRLRRELCMLYTAVPAWLRYRVEAGPGVRPGQASCRMFGIGIGVGIVGIVGIVGVVGVVGVGQRR